MTKTFSNIIYLFLKFLNKIFYFLFKKNFLYWIRYFIEKDAYKSLTINSEKKLKLFSPNILTEDLINDFFVKEPETLNWIDKFDDTKKSYFWDIGSNIGLYSVYAATVKNNISVVSFEPSTSNLRILSRNISINNLQKKIKIFQIPLTDKKNTFLEIFERKFGEGESHNTLDEKIGFDGKKIISNNSYKLFSSSIDQLIDDKILNIPNYIKIDVDGLEHLILKGALKTLKSPDILEIQIEINELFSEQKKSIFQILEGCNFIFKEKKRNEFSKYYISKEFSKIYNYYFIKKG